MVRLSVGVVASAGIYAVLLLAPDWWNDAVPTGGFDWRSLLKSTWEAHICAGMCVGFLLRSMFRKFGLATIVGVLLAFGIGHLSRRVPGLRATLGTAPKEGG